jgi:hypothetical protein
MVAPGLPMSTDPRPDSLSAASRAELNGSPASGKGTGAAQLPARSSKRYRNQIGEQHRHQPDPWLPERTTFRSPTVAVVRYCIRRLEKSGSARFARFRLALWNDLAHLGAVIAAAGESREIVPKQQESGSGRGSFETTASPVRRSSSAEALVAGSLSGEVPALGSRRPLLRSCPLMSGSGR